MGIRCAFKKILAEKKRLGKNLNPPSNKENHRARRGFLRAPETTGRNQIPIFHQKSAQSIETNLMFRFSIDELLWALCGLVVVLGELLAS
jgi:hypothetical protein